MSDELAELRDRLVALAGRMLESRRIHLERSDELWFLLRDSKSLSVEQARNAYRDYWSARGSAAASGGWHTELADILAARRDHT